MMQVAERNRAIKRVLGGVFGRDKVTVRGSRGTGYGWVSVKIDWTPLDRDEATAERVRCKGLLRDAGIDLGRTYTDDTCQYTTDQCSLDFNHALYRQTMTYSDGTRAGLRWDDDQWEPIALDTDSRASEAEPVAPAIGACDAAG